MKAVIKKKLDYIIYTGKNKKEIDTFLYGEDGKCKRDIDGSLTCEIWTGYDSEYESVSIGDYIVKVEDLFDDYVWASRHSNYSCYQILSAEEFNKLYEVQA